METSFDISLLYLWFKNYEATIVCELLFMLHYELILLKQIKILRLRMRIERQKVYQNAWQFNFAIL